MRRTTRFSGMRLPPVLVLVLMTLGGCASARPGPSVHAVWQHHHTTIHYHGLTAQYSCTGFRDDINALLLYLGARPDDLHVQMAECNRGFNQPGQLASATADFYSLAPAGAAAPGAIEARWEPLTLIPHMPFWLGFGDCEFIAQVKPLVTEYFAVRRLRYDTACVAHAVTIADYSVQGQILKAVR